ncbi:MAG: hypothetical protein AVDCRST_MAG73-2114, partial [uncultured Thermomicrobiales bacterium]
GHDDAVDGRRPRGDGRGRVPRRPDRGGTGEDDAGGWSPRGDRRRGVVPPLARRRPGETWPGLRLRHRLQGRPRSRHGPLPRRRIRPRRPRSAVRGTNRFSAVGAGPCGRDRLSLRPRADGLPEDRRLPSGRHAAALGVPHRTAHRHRPHPGSPAPGPRTRRRPSGPSSLKCRV